MSSAEKGLPAKERSALKLKGWPLILLSFQTLGIIYSDIGTSPLYVLNGIWPSTGPVPSKEDVIGGISAIVWSLTLIPLIKYVFISLRFGTGIGEGGTFALFQGLYPPQSKDDDRTLTGDSFVRGGLTNESRYKLTEKLRWPLLAWSLLGTSLTMADGIFTPAVSVTSAVGGIAVAKASVSHDITSISIAILVVLFLGQQFGTTRLSFLFAPISLLWFLILAGSGIYNITYFPGIFRALDPSRAILLFVRTKNYDILSGVLLAVTGCEAIFANLGQFNALSIQLSFGLFVFPSLILAYLGQGARLVVDGETVLQNIFYQTIPGPQNGGLFWIVFVVAILATIIASQALITATFSLCQQIVHMKSLPPIHMVYTSDTIQGQVYLPVVNWALMIATIVVVAAFKNLAALTRAYGFAVATVMFSTTVLLAIQMRYVKRWPFMVGIVYFIFFGFIDGLFWGAALKKVPDGAWVPLMIGSALCILMLFWTWAKGLEDKFDSENRMNLRHVIQPNRKEEEGDSNTVSEEEGDQPTTFHLAASRNRNAEKSPSDKQELVRINSCAIFHKLSTGKGVPHSFTTFIRQWPALPRVVVFLSVGIVNTARVDPADRYSLTKVRTIDGFYGVTYNVGFRDNFDVKIEELIDRICELEAQADPARSNIIIAEIRSAATTATHLVPHYNAVSKEIGGGSLSSVSNKIRAFLIESIYHRLATMFPETANWLTSADEIIHVGITAAI